MDDRSDAANLLNLSYGKSIHPHSANYYINFSKVSHKLGAVATRNYFKLIERISHEMVAAFHSTGSSIAHIVPSSLSGLVSRESHADKKAKADENNDSLDDIIKRSHEILMEAKTVFPMTLFRDKVTVDRTKLTIHRKTFFLSGKVITIHIEDVLNVAVEVGPLFGSLVLAIKGLTSEDHFRVNYFWRSDAIKLKHIIQGHVIAQHDKIDYKHMDHEVLIETLMKLGHDTGT